MGRERPGARDRAGRRDAQGADPRVDEPRVAREDRRHRRGALLVALAPQALAQGRGIGPRAEGARGTHRLRRGRGAARGRAGGRNRLPHGPRALLLPQARRPALGRDRGGRARSPGDLQEMSDILERLADVVESRKAGDPDVSYVARLFARGEDAILKKIGEEATETVMAAKDGDRLRIVGETADLWFHCLIMLAQHGLRPSDVLAELRRREGISGIDEKAARADDARIEAERKGK